ncbi:MAG TPA: protein kinase, partial [Vicinamibacterales bacterium]
MALATGSWLGSHEIVAQIGAGGMGEVYRARDTKLNRDVAIKVLPEIFAADPERLARFTREAQTLAALNHPNIAHIYGVEESGKVHALVMEFVDGEDLAQRLVRGAIPLDEALPIARQIADALEAAHEQGIVHRDLKPANIKIRPDGTVKVLDFGLAKAMGAGPEDASSPNVANSPTFTAHATQLGMILGTAAYMAPEQARGKTVDRRADIWAFGAVLYEMLTGKRPFEGDEISDVLASVLKSDPVWSAIPADAPASIRRLLHRCLEKDPRKRLSAIGDARFDLDERDALDAPAVGPALSMRPRRAWSTSLAWALAGALVTAAILLWMRPSPSVNTRATRLSILPPAGASPLYPDATAVAISPDGTQIAFELGNNTSTTELWVRSLGSLDAHRLDATIAAQMPFWSPDSRRIGFFAGDKLETIDATGGRAQVLCDAPNGGRGAVWTPANDIIFAPEVDGPLYRISASGGTPTRLTTLDPSRKESGHRFPSLLPDGDHFLYAALPGHDGLFDIVAGSISDPKARTVIGSMETAPVYADPGWLLHMRQGALAAQRFDAKALKLIGHPLTFDDAPSTILDPRFSYTAGRPVSVASNGLLAYSTDPSDNTNAIWLDTAGQTTGTLNVPRGHYDFAAIAPDGLHAVLVRSTSPSQSSLWLTDLARGGATPLTTGHGRNDSPVWSPDGSRLVFDSDRDGAGDLYVKELNDSSPERLLHRSTVLFENPESWSPDGKSIVMTLVDAGTQDDVWVLDADGRELRPLVNGPGKDLSGRVSPDGHSLLYVSNETGRPQLYVTAFPHQAPHVQVSTDGAFGGWWMPDGRQIVYVSEDWRTLSRVDIQAGSPARVS